METKNYMVTAMDFQYKIAIAIKSTDKHQLPIQQLTLFLAVLFRVLVAAAVAEVEAAAPVTS
jgi:hypothetical protein